MRRRDHREITLARVRIGDEGDVAEAEVLSVTFIVAEEEDLVATDGAAERAAEIVALELGNLLLVEVVAGIERASCGEIRRPRHGIGSIRWR